MMRGVVGGATVGTGLALKFASAPAWMVVLAIVLAFVLASINAVFPQDSHDRLDWWRHVLRRDSEGTAGPPGARDTDRRARQGSNLRPSA